MRQEVTLLASSFGTEVAFIEPEILQIGRDKLLQFVASEPRLTSYRFYVEEILRTAAHTLSEAEEKILATRSTRHGGTVDDLRAAAERRVPISDHHAGRWTRGQSRSADVR